jgi:hypothetical protein
MGKYLIIRENRCFFLEMMFLAVVLFFPCVCVAATVRTVAELAAAVSTANSGGDNVILLEDGIYTLDSALVIQAHGVTIRSLSGNRGSVTIRGNGMTGSVSHVFFVEGDHFTARDMTLRDVYYHAIQMQIDAQAPTFLNLHILDTYEQMIKVPYDEAQPDRHSDDGLVQDCLFEYSAGIGPQWYIGGVDGHHAHNWVVRGNTFKNIRSPADDVAEHAIHFWSGSQNTLVEGNTIVNCDRGIGFGLGNRGHVGGIIRNNMIYHDVTEGFADVGIGLESAPGAQVYNNTIFQEHAYLNAIEYRFAATTGVHIINNLTNRAIARRDGASGTVSHNVTHGESGWFVSPVQGDLHLGSSVADVVDQGVFVSGLVEDFDGDSRPQGTGYDVGADEYSITWVCPDCSSDEVVIQNVTFPAGKTCECEGAISITVESNVTIEQDAVVSLVSPLVKIRSRVIVQQGALLTIRQGAQ